MPYINQELLIDALAIHLGFKAVHTDVMTCDIFDGDLVVINGGYPYVIMCLKRLQDRRRNAEKL